MLAVKAIVRKKVPACRTSTQRLYLEYVALIATILTQQIAPV
jgi:hypothetical protein